MTSGLWVCPSCRVHWRAIHWIPRAGACVCGCDLAAPSTQQRDKLTCACVRCVSHRYWGLLHLLRESEVPRLPSPPFSKLAADFIGLMLIKDPRKRPEASELLKHKFLAKCAKTVAAHRQAAASKANVRN